LQGLNSDQGLNRCLSNLISATSDFADSNGSATTDSINGVLSTVCASSWNYCDASAIRQSLVSFYTNCQDDMLGTNGATKNDDVIARYDWLYLIVPLKGAMCTKDSDNAFCLSKLNSGTASPFTSGTVSHSSTVAALVGSSVSSGSGSSSSSSSAAASTPTNAKRSHHLNQEQMFKRAGHHHNALVARQQSNNTQTPLVNSDAYNQQGLPYLFLTPSSSDAQVCSQCTYNVLLGYITFESITPYAIGIQNSPILKGQVALWDRVKTCANGLANAIVSDATYQANTSGALEDATVFGGATMVAAIAAALFGTLSLF
jgi:hypothetical protein